jgi:ATP-dependent Lon protease
VHGHETLPIVPLRDVVVFPWMTVPFVVGRPSSVRAVERALAADKRIFVAVQLDAAVDDPHPGDIHSMGCVATIDQSLKLPDGNMKVLITGIDRARAVEWKDEQGFSSVVVKVLNRQRYIGSDLEAAIGRARALFEQYFSLSNDVDGISMLPTRDADDPGKLSDRIAAHLSVGVHQKHELLEIVSPIERLNSVTRILEAEVPKLQVEHRIQARVEREVKRLRTKRYVARRRRAIQSEIEKLKSKIESSGTSEDVKIEAARDLEHLEAMSKMPDDAIRLPRNWRAVGPLSPHVRERLARLDEILSQRARGSAREQQVTPQPEQPLTPQTRVAAASIWAAVVAGLIGSGLFATLRWLFSR